MDTITILDRLISFDTTSHKSNMDLMDYVKSLLKEAGTEVQLIANDAKDKANLYATIGPKDRGGILLSGHSDVVPIDGQDWTVPPFEMTHKNGRYYGRGTTDMKGFVAASLAIALKAAKSELKTPLHLALSYDEEIGCVGVHSLIEMLQNAPFRPICCIVGEPTQMRVAVGHKGKIAARATCIGQEAHSALAPMGLNAIHLAADLLAEMRNLQRDIASNGPQDADYDVPYSTIHAGRINGGVALNIVPNHCVLDFEIRNIAEDDPAVILDKIKQAAAKIVAQHKDEFSAADIEIEEINSYPGLGQGDNLGGADFVRSLIGANSTCKVAFGTEGGLFQAQAGIPAVICGPGSMLQGHKPDEYIDASELEKCDAMLNVLLTRLEQGVQI